MLSLDVHYHHYIHISTHTTSFQPQATPKYFFGNAKRKSPHINKKIYIRMDHFIAPSLVRVNFKKYFNIKTKLFPIISIKNKLTLLNQRTRFFVNVKRKSPYQRIE